MSRGQSSRHSTRGRTPPQRKVLGERLILRQPPWFYSQVKGRNVWGFVDILTLPKCVLALYEIASGILAYDLLYLCFRGPKEKLDKTVYSQPAILVNSLAALERLNYI